MYFMKYGLEKRKLKYVFISFQYSITSILDMNMRIVLNKASYVLDAYLDKFQLILCTCIFLRILSLDRGQTV
jgi:hypothetical protein